MMKTIIGDILEKCPKGMVLYSPAYGLVKLLEIDVVDSRVKKTPMIHCKSVGSGNDKTFFRDGSISTNGECVLFPSKTLLDWDSFVIPVFCPGQTIVRKDSSAFLIGIKITSVTGEYYVTGEKESIPINQQLNYELFEGKGDTSERAAHLMLCEEELGVLLKRLEILGICGTEALDWILKKATKDENSK